MNEKVWKVYLSGEIHSDWREQIADGVAKARGRGVVHELQSAFAVELQAGVVLREELIGLADEEETNEEQNRDCEERVAPKKPLDGALRTDS